MPLNYFREDKQRAFTFVSIFIDCSPDNEAGHHFFPSYMLFESGSSLTVQVPVHSISFSKESLYRWVVALCHFLWKQKDLLSFVTWFKVVFVEFSVLTKVFRKTTFLSTTQTWRQI